MSVSATDGDGVCPNSPDPRLAIDFEVITKKLFSRVLHDVRFRHLGREFLWIGSGQAVATVGMLVGVRLITGVLSPEVYGQLALGMTLGTLVNQVILGPLAGAALRFFSPARDAGELASFLAALRRMLVQATLLVALLGVVVPVVLLVLGQSHLLWLAFAALAFALVSGFNSTLDGLQNAARQRTIVAWHNALSSWGRFLLAFGMVLWLGTSSAVAMTGYACATLVVLVSQLWFFRRTIHPSEIAAEADGEDARQWNRRMFDYAWPFSTFGVFTFAQMASDRWALEAFATTREVGLYAVVYQLGYYPITILTALLVQLVSPIFFQRAGDGSDVSRVQQVHRLNRRLTFAVLLLTGLAVLVAFGVHGLVFRWLVAPEYRGASWLLPGMVLAGGLFATAQFAVVSLLSGVQTHILIWPKVGGAGLGILLNVIGAAGWGVIGVVVASVVAAAAYLFWILCLVETRYRHIGSQAVH